MGYFVVFVHIFKTNLSFDEYFVQSKSYFFSVASHKIHEVPY